MHIRPTLAPRFATALVAAAVLVAGCATSTPSPAPSATMTATPSPSAAPVSPTPSSPAPSEEAGPPASPIGDGLALAVVAGLLDSPVDIATAGDGSGRIFVVEQSGTIRIVQDGERLSTPFLDISGQITSGGERGLLGLAFHPDFPADPRFFVDYTDAQGDTVISSFRVDPASPDQVDPESELILLTIPQPYANHNGGSLAFDNDGMLLIGMGDGGSGGDPEGNGQRLDRLLGKILRIDVLGTEATAEKPYGIPSDNPYATTAGVRPEIWLSGLRNPWRMRIDEATGDLWIGDVGQGDWEEIDVIRAGGGGQNLGWNTMEGTHCFRPNCDPARFTLPVAEYDHGSGCSVTGGVVVRGSSVPAVQDRYLFSDYCSGTLWSLDPTSDTLTEPTVVGETGRAISSFWVAEDGSILLTDLNGGQLLRLVSAP